MSTAAHFEWKSVLNFNPCAQFQTFRHLTPSSFKLIPTLPLTFKHLAPSLRIVYLQFGRSVTRTAESRSRLSEVGQSHSSKFPRFYYCRSFVTEWMETFRHRRLLRVLLSTWTDSVFHAAQRVACVICAVLTVLSSYRMCKYVHDLQSFRATGPSVSLM